MPRSDETFIVRVRVREDDAVVEQPRLSRRRRVRDVAEVGGQIVRWLDPPRPGPTISGPACEGGAHMKWTWTACSRSGSRQLPPPHRLRRRRLRRRDGRQGRPSGGDRPDDQGYLDPRQVVLRYAEAHSGGRQGHDRAPERQRARPQRAGAHREVLLQARLQGPRRHRGDRSDEVRQEGHDQGDARTSSPAPTPSSARSPGTSRRASAGR